MSWRHRVATWILRVVLRWSRGTVGTADLLLSAAEVQVYPEYPEAP